MTPDAARVTRAYADLMADAVARGLTQYRDRLPLPLWPPRWMGACRHPASDPQAPLRVCVDCGCVSPVIRAGVGDRGAAWVARCLACGYRWVVKTRRQRTAEEVQGMRARTPCRRSAKRPSYVYDRRT